MLTPARLLLLVLGRLLLLHLRPSSSHRQYNHCFKRTVTNAQSIRIYNRERRAAARAIEVGRRVRIDGMTLSDQYGTQCVCASAAVFFRRSPSPPRTRSLPPAISLPSFSPPAADARRYNGRLGVIRETKKSSLVVALYRPGEGTGEGDVVQAKHQTIEAKPEHLLPFPPCVFYHHVRQALDSVHEDEINSKHLRTLIAPAIQRRLHDPDELLREQQQQQQQRPAGRSVYASASQRSPSRRSKPSSPRSPLARRKLSAK